MMTEITVSIKFKSSAVYLFKKVVFCVFLYVSSHMLRLKYPSTITGLYEYCFDSKECCKHPGWGGEIFSVLGLIPFSCGLFFCQWCGRKFLSNIWGGTVCQSTSAQVSSAGIWQEVGGSFWPSSSANKHGRQT